MMCVCVNVVRAQGIQGVDNVYTQHEPLLCATLEVRGRQLCVCVCV